MQPAKPRILILTTRTGGGHLNLAQALEGMLNTAYEVVIVTAQSVQAGHFYTFVSRHCTPYLTWQYACTDNKLAALCLHTLVSFLDKKNLRAIIEDAHPDLIIATHALLAYTLARVNERLSKPLPLVFQLTDLGQLHMTWFTEKSAAAYLVPTREIFAQALEQGIAHERLHLTGRPIRQQFLAFADGADEKRTAMLANLKLDPARLTIFLQGGAQGSAGVDQTIEHLLDTELPVQIILAVGNNASMAARYADAQWVRPLPFTSHIAPYMAASDIIAGKAGASFISEAFTLEKPFLATAFIPGQETANLHFLERHNLGWVALEVQARRTLLSALASDPTLLAEKRASIQTYKCWNMQVNAHLRPVIAELLP